MENFRTLSTVERDFKRNAICSDLDTVPGIGRKDEQMLRDHGITTTDQLVGRYFMCNRDVELFIMELEDYGIQSKWAKICATAINEKFKDL